MVFINKIPKKTVIFYGCSNISALRALYFAKKMFLLIVQKSTKTIMRSLYFTKNQPRTCWFPSILLNIIQKHIVFAWFS